jgi:glycosyltransferase involved in cell wall biosynthesis
VFTEKSKTILIVVSNYLPGFKLGGPITSISNLVNSLSKDYNFKIFTLDRDYGDKMPYPNITTGIWLQKDSYQILYVKRNLFTLYYLMYFINRTPADILYLNSFFDPLFSISLVIAKKFRMLKIVDLMIAPRGELFKEAMEFRKLKKKIYISLARIFNLYKNIYWHSTSNDEKFSIIESIKINADKIRIATIISNSFNEKTTSEQNELIPAISKGKTTLRIVFLSRISKDKNLIFALKVLQQVKCEAIFDIYGPIEDKYIWDTCKEQIKNIPQNIIVSYLGIVKRENVKNILQSYDLFFLPTFRENFGHIIVEALSVGTPVLLSDKTPWRNLEEKRWGWDLSLNHPQLFVETIHKMAMYPKSYLKENRSVIKNSFIEHLKNPEILNANKELFMIPFKDA